MMNVLKTITNHIQIKPDGFHNIQHQPITKHSVFAIFEALGKAKIALHYLDNNLAYIFGGGGGIGGRKGCQSQKID